MICCNWRRSVWYAVPGVRAVPRMDDYSEGQKDALPALTAHA